MRSKFDKELNILHNNLVEMASLIEIAIGDAIKSLLNQDGDLARKSIEYDNEIDLKEKEIERRCLQLLMQQQPVATDLRVISTALKMITDMERIGDHAADIAEITLRLLGQEYIKKLEHIPQMGEATIKMVKDSIDAFILRDEASARAVIAEDDIIDDLFETVRNDLIVIIQNNADSGAQAADLLMIAKYLERIGDHAVNIAEWVIFSMTGEHKNAKIM